MPPIPDSPRLECLGLVAFQQVRSACTNRDWIVLDRDRIGVAGYLILVHVACMC